MIRHDSVTFHVEQWVAGATGFEPVAFGFGEHRSTIFHSESQRLERAGRGRIWLNASQLRHADRGRGAGVEQL